MENTRKQPGRKRVQTLKKLIVAILLSLILIPSALCAVLWVQLHSARKEVERLREQNERLEALEQAESRTRGAYSVSGVQESAGTGEGKKDRAEQTQGPSEAEGETHNVYLTFDDGPSENTEEILDILKAYDVKATFFVVGKPEERYRKEYVRIVEEGHTLGMHSYSHKYDEIYASLDAYKEDLERLQEFLYETTGVWSRYCRFPGGSSNTVSRVDMRELIDYIEGQDIAYYDWNVESGDTTSGKVSATRLVENCTTGIAQLRNAVVLMHDAADKDTTVEALPTLIQKVREMEHTRFLPITDDTAPVHHQIVGTDPQEMPE